VLYNMLNQFVFVYLGDLLIFPSQLKSTSSVSNSSSSISWRTSCLLKQRCEFYCSTISFLGYAIGTGNIQMDSDKVRAVVDWPQPTSRVQLQHFLGSAHFYRRFIRHCSTLASSFLSTHLSQGSFHMVSNSRPGILKSQVSFHYSSHLNPPGLVPSVRGGCRRLQRRSRGCPVPVFCPGLKAASLHLPFPPS
jgi:hypothetical protein